MTTQIQAPDRIRPSWMNEDLCALADIARTFFERDVIPHKERFAAQGRPDKATFKRAGEQGLLCLSIPEEYGGGGGTIAHDAVLFTEQVRSGDHSMHLGVHSTIVPHYLLAYGTEEQKQRWLPKLASGELVAAIAMTEPGAGTDLQRITTRATRDGDSYLVSGSKTFISNGLNADLIIVAVKTDPSLGAKGVSLLVVEVGDEPRGFSRGKAIHKVGQQGQDTAELFFDELRVPVENRLADEGTGFAQLMTQLAYERLVCGISAVVAMERAVDLTVTYAKERQMFGATLFDLQNTRFELAECQTIAQVSRTFIDSAIEQQLAGTLTPTTAAMVKYWLTDRQCEVVDRCLQLFGGYGYTLEYPIGQMYADARIQRIYAGANEVMKDLIARTL